MNRLTSMLMNPVLNKEVKLRFRSFKSYLGLFFYLLVVGVVALAYIYIETNARYGSIGFQADNSRLLFIILSVVQLMLIVFMTPGLTSGVISGEREKQTLNILLTTQQTSAAIVVSKLLSSISYLVLMVTASLPLYSIVFLYGGISPKMVLMTFLVFLLTMITIGSIGVMFSTLIRKTIVSTITTYGLTLFLVGGTALLFLFLGQLIYGYNPGAQPQTNPIPYFVFMLNPAFVLVTMFQPAFGEEMLQHTGIQFPLWISFTMSYLTITVVSLTLAVRALRPSMKTKRISAKKDVADEQ